MKTEEKREGKGGEEKGGVGVIVKWRELVCET